MLSGLNPGQDEIDEMIEETDKDHSGAIDFREFCSLMVKREHEKETVEDLKQAFRVFDKARQQPSLCLLCNHNSASRMEMDMCRHQNLNL